MELSVCYDHFLICHSMRQDKHSFYRASLTTLQRIKYSHITPVGHVKDGFIGPITHGRFEWCLLYHLADSQSLV